MNGYWEYKNIKSEEPSVKIKNEGVQVRIMILEGHIQYLKNINNILVYKQLYKQLKDFFPFIIVIKKLILLIHFIN